MDWKIIATLAIVMAIGVAIVSRTPEVSRFLEDMYSYVSPLPGNVTFALNAAYSGNVTLDAVNSSVEILPASLSLEIAGGALESRSRVTLSGFRGTVNVHENSAEIDGTADAIDAGGAIIRYSSGPVKGIAEFSALSVAGVAMRSLSVNVSSGTLDADGKNTSLNSGVIAILSPSADYAFSGGTMYAKGIARRIEVPSSGIIIG